MIAEVGLVDNGQKIERRDVEALPTARIEQLAMETVMATERRLEIIGENDFTLARERDSNVARPGEHHGGQSHHQQVSIDRRRCGFHLLSPHSQGTYCWAGSLEPRDCPAGDHYSGGTANGKTDRTMCGGPVPETCSD